jgi:hypothetical protein
MSTMSIGFKRIAFGILSTSVHLGKSSNILRGGRGE